MRYRCANCTQVYLVSGSMSLYPQSFCGKACEVESIVMHQESEDLTTVLASLEWQSESPVELVH